ncbi:MAG TPA: alpha/beta fold hydrolase [Dehalococcoidia bacterium]|nr:alpha/beta fold hydrolase [Dehalococcoidia bacterium]
MTASDLHHGFIEANGIRFHYAEQGDGPLVLLLHGFPECWYSWRFQLPALAAAGYHAVAPDLRGYNLSDKPRSGYGVATLAADVEAIGRAFGAERAHVVGHDWGGIIAWQTAWRRPAFVRTLVTMNAPQPAAFARYALRTPAQLLKSSYMFLFQVPRLPEWFLCRDNAAAIAKAFPRAAVRRDAFTAADLAFYREAFLRPGVARSALNYYRQAVRQGFGALPTSPVVMPALVLWGEGDPVLNAAMNDRLGDWARNLTYRPIPDCGHWTQQERPDIVNAELVAWLGAHASYP